jgi:hypothetical protein
MKRKQQLIATAALAAVTIAAPAMAQEEGTPYLQRSVAAPKRAFELTAGGGYNQPFGDIQRGYSIRDTAGGGGTVQIGAGYRFNPRWMLGLTGSYGQFGNGDGRADFVNAGDARTMTGGVEGVFHARPYDRVDPFISLGTGWRGMWERHEGPSNDVFRHGLQLARLGLGVDFRVSRDVSIAPIVAGDANIFLWQNAEGVADRTTIADPRVNVFLSAGLQGRFDLGGERVDRYGTLTSQTTVTSVPVERMPEPEPIVVQPVPVHPVPVHPAPAPTHTHTAPADPTLQR